MKLIRGNVEHMLISFRNDKLKLLFFLLFAAFLFLRFYDIPGRAYLGWDQADSAWAAKSILNDNPLRLEGVPIKGNASMFMGPLYYYLIAPFYYVTNLDIIASPIAASVISVFTFLLFYYFTKKLFDRYIAIIAAFIYTFSMLIIGADRLQAAYVLIPILSYAVFYFLYRLITGNERSILYAAAVIGFSFHVHFTAVFFLIICLLTVPFFPKTKRTLLYSGLGLLVFVILLSPLLYSVFFAKSSGSNGIVQYLQSSYHGFHLRRVVQLVHDGFISFKAIIPWKFVNPVGYVLLPLFIYFYSIKSNKKERRNRLLLCYLMALFVIVPWLIFSTYNGELTDYYFSHSRYLAVTVTAYLLFKIYTMKYIAGRIVVILTLGIYALYSLYQFMNVFPGNYISLKQSVASAIVAKQKIPYKERDPLFYIYEVETRYKH